eukprot:745882-Hanusia_phi.AAC.5
MANGGVHGQADEDGTAGDEARRGGEERVGGFTFACFEVRRGASAGNMSQEERGSAGDHTGSP